MPEQDYLGSFEQVVLLAIVRLRDDAYGMSVRRELELQIGRTASLGAVYATLDRLEKKGYIVSREGRSCASRSGRVKRLVRVEPRGMAALRRSLESIEAMSKGVRELKRPIGGLS